MHHYLSLYVYLLTLYLISSNIRYYGLFVSVRPEEANFPYIFSSPACLHSPKAVLDQPLYLMIHANDAQHAKVPLLPPKTTTTTNYTEAHHQTGDKGPRKAPQPMLCPVEAPVLTSTLTPRNHQMAKQHRHATSKPVTAVTHHPQPLTRRSMHHHHHLHVGTATSRASHTSVQCNLRHQCMPPLRRHHDRAWPHSMQRSIWAAHPTTSPIGPEVPACH